MNLTALLTSSLVKVALVTGCLLSVACSADVGEDAQMIDPVEEVDGVSGPREVTTDVAYGPCQDGYVRECTVVLPSQNGVKNCVYGLQLCEEGVWSECLDPEDMEEVGGISELEAGEVPEETTDSL